VKIPILRIQYTEDDLEYIKIEIERVLRSGYLTMADRVEEFERMFSAYCGTKYAVGTNSGTSSIEAILRAIGVQGKTIIVPSNTYMATALAVIKAGGKVIFAECERDNLQMNPDDILRKLKKDTKGVIIVHIGGIISPRFSCLKEICEKNGLFLIEDAAHAHGATIDGQMAGSLCLAGSFSFYPTKVLTTAEGGMITTDDTDIFTKSKILREHGKADHNANVHVDMGDNWRFSEIHAVLGIRQMMKAQSILNERRHIAALYDDMLRDVDGIYPVRVPTNIQPSYYKYIAFLDEQIDRDRLKSILKENYDVVLPGEVYAHPCHSQPVFEKYPETVANSKRDKFPVTEYVSRHHVCMPLYPGLSTDEVEYIVDSLKKAIAGFPKS
jgi:perosamine synthetase